MKDSSSDEQISINAVEEVRSLLGPLDSNTRLIRELFGVNVLVRDGAIRLLGDEEGVKAVKAVLDAALTEFRRGQDLSANEVADRLRGKSGGDSVTAESWRPAAKRSQGGVRAKTPGQARYLESMQKGDVIFGVGPAGTGKTYLAVSAAVAAIRSGGVKRIVLVRPAVEAGERLGFLPGDLQAKIDPYLRPLYDALHELLDDGTRTRYLEGEVIEVCPLAYMRGRTLNDAFVILDEAQNCTVPQMLMFLTRMGEGSRFVVTGDPSQVDLPRDVSSGLSDALRRLGGVKGVDIVRLGVDDIVRHPVVRRIISAYEIHDNTQKS